MTSLSEDQGKNKLALLVLGAILGAGSYTVAKSLLSKKQNKLKSKEEKKVT